MKLEKIEKLKNSKYKLTFDNGDIITTYDDVILNNNLLSNRDIDKKRLDKIELDNEYFDIYFKVIMYIQLRIRSEKEINLYLNKNKVRSKLKNQLIENLKEEGFINDEKFCRAYINDKFNLNSSGPNKIKRELLDHNIKTDLIDTYLAEVDEDNIYEKLEKLIKKRLASNSKYSKYQLKSNILLYFNNLGYSSNMINELFEKHYIYDSEIIKKEYIKLQRKLGKDMDCKIKEGLYKKGFNSNEINDLLNNIK